MSKAKTLVVALLIVGLWSAIAGAQSSSGYPMPGCKVVSATAASLQGCSAGCELCNVSGYSSSGSLYLQFFPATACPAANTVPAYEIALAATSNFSSGQWLGHWYNTGLMACMSSTSGVYTASATTAFISLAVSQ